MLRELSAHGPATRGSDLLVGAIRQTILELKEPYHKVSVLFFLEEKSVDEIAQELERPKKTVQTQLYRARSKLQKILMEEMKT